MSKTIRVDNEVYVEIKRLANGRKMSEGIRVALSKAKGARTEPCLHGEWQASHNGVECGKCGHEAEETASDHGVECMAATGAVWECLKCGYVWEPSTPAEKSANGVLHQCPETLKGEGLKKVGTT